MILSAHPRLNAVSKNIAKRSAARRRGFTIIEMLIVVAIIAIISGVIGAATELALHSGADMRARMDTQSEAASLMIPLSREFAAAQWIKRTPRADSTSPTLALALRIPETENEPEGKAWRWIVYRHTGDCIRRMALAPGEELDPRLLAPASNASSSLEASHDEPNGDISRREQTFLRNAQQFYIQRKGELIEVAFEAQTVSVGKPIRLQSACAFRAFCLEKYE